MEATARINGNILKECTLENFDYQVDPYVGYEHYCCYCYTLNQAGSD